MQVSPSHLLGVSAETQRAVGALAELAPQQVVFWSGAGISRPSPTCGLGGPALTSRALDNYFMPQTKRQVERLYEQLHIPHAALRPRLETVLDALYEVYGDAGLRDVLSDLVSAPPNALHRFFHRHLRAGGAHITTNFDTCVERAGEGAPQECQLLHVHGALDDGADLAALGARLSVIENKLPPEVRNALDALLSDPGTEALVFVGYSGSDFFDVTPYLHDRRGLLAGRTVVWHAFDPEDGEHPYVVDLREAGARTLRLEGPLPQPLAVLAKAWGLPWQTAPPLADVPAGLWGRALAEVEGQRQEATLALFARMGVKTAAD